MTKAMEKLLWFVLVLAPRTQAGDLLTEETIARRRLTKFMVGHKDNQECWERHRMDGFLSPIDAHNHFRPFFGPPVPWDTYMEWMRDHGILFTTMLGIGQQLMKKDPNSKDCCYYLHCANYDYPVTPDPINDIRNAQDFQKYYKDKDLSKQIHLLPSVTSPNLQQPENNSNVMEMLQKKFPGVFGWAGEINVYKHALAANGFLHNGNRVNEAFLERGSLDPLFKELENLQWPTTLHCDLGCDQYESVPWEQGCFVPQEELDLAKNNHKWWEQFLGPHYRAFFDALNDNTPKKNFKKIQHLKIWDSLLTRYPNLIVVWAHLGLSKELKHLHPTVHAHIISTLFERHPNLYADVSWDVLSKQLFMNFKEGTNASYLHPSKHEDLDKEIDKSIVDTAAIEDLREDLLEVWEIHEQRAKTHGSITGPTHAMAIYLELFHKHSDRFITGTDFVSSFGAPDKYPGTLEKGRGCVKDKKNHARQVMDTGSINMFLNDESFKQIVLGGNYFKITRLQHKFQPPPVCGDTLLPVETIIAIGVGAAVLVITVVVVAVAVLCCCRKKDDGSFIRVDGRGGSATTNV